MSARLSSGAESPGIQTHQNRIKIHLQSEKWGKRVKRKNRVKFYRILKNLSIARVKRDAE